MKLKMTPTEGGGVLLKPERIKPHGVNEGPLKIMPETFLMLGAVKCERSESNGEDKLLNNRLRAAEEQRTFTLAHTRTGTLKQCVRSLDFVLKWCVCCVGVGVTCSG